MQSKPGSGIAPIRRVTAWTPVFAAILLYVAAVSAYDGYLVICTGDMIQDFEQNPVGLLLIKLNGGDTELFLRAKAAGTTIVLFALGVLNRRSRRLARPVALSLVAFQSWLLFFLEHNWPAVTGVKGSARLGGRF